MVYKAHVVGIVHMLWTLTVMSPEDVCARAIGSAHMLSTRRGNIGDFDVYVA